MTDILAQFLEEGELFQLSGDIRSKLEKEFRSKDAVADSLKCEVEKVTADYEQKCYEIDKKMIEMSTQLDTETSNSAKATARCAELENELKMVKEKSSALEMNFAEAQGEMAALKRTHDIWKEEKLSMQHLIEKRDLEVNELKGEWKALSDKLATVTTNKNEIELKLDELQNSGVTAQYHNKRLEREKELLAQQNEQLNEEIKSKSAELNSFKLNKENELVSLRGRLEVKMDECKQLAMVSENLRTTNDDLEKKVSELLEKANMAEEERRSMEELYRNELQSQVNLTELYKASSKDAEEKSKELASAVQELQKLVTESEDAHKSTQANLDASEEKITEMIRENELLNKELEKANDLLEAKKGEGPENLTGEELAALCPTAAMASKFIKSGMTLTEMYTKYVDALDEIEVAKTESKRLSDAMDAILEELNEKAPILKQQREDYERALATITQLTSQMDSAAIECQQLRAETDDAGRKLARVEREKKRLQMESGDLSVQIRFLLKELEESRGHNVSMERSTDGDVSNVSSSSEVISTHLVTFKSIEDLQSQNQRLLQVVRELSDASEKKERENESDEMKQLKETLDRATEDLEALRKDRARQNEFVEAIVKQRDMYRVLLSQEPKSGIPLSIVSGPPQITTFGKGASDGDGPSKSRPLSGTESSSEALKVLKQEFDEYKQEVQENNKVMNEQTNSLRSQITELRADNAKLQANVNFSAEKYNVMKQSFDNIRKESEMLREKNSKLLVLIQKHELNFNNVTNDLTVARQMKAKLEAKTESLQSEMDILRRTEDRLRSENASLQRDQRGQSVLLANLQKIQQSMEKQEFEVRSELRGRLEAQERELKTLRRSTNETVQQKQAALQMTEKQLLAARKNLEQQRSEKEALSAEVRNLKSQLEASDLEQKSSASKVVALEQRLSRLVGDKAVNLVREKGDAAVGSEANEEIVSNLKDMKEKCASLDEEVASLKVKLEKSHRAVQQHKEFASAAEESLKQANEANRELSEALEARLKNASEHQTKLEQKITILEDENRKLNSNKTNLISEVDLRTADLKRQLASLQSELDMVLKREKELRKSEQDARSQFTEQMDLIHDAQNKYQREMLLHAESVKELMELKEKFKKSDSELETIKNEAEQAKHLLNSNKGMWEKQKTKLEEENEEMKQRNKDMNEQLTALHTQLETMSSQMVVLQQKHTVSPVSKYARVTTTQHAESSSTEDTHDKSNEQLIDIIKFLRKEKNLCEVKYEVAQSEKNRLKQQASHLQKQSDEAKKALHEEQQKSQANSSELSKHEALMKKVETLNVLSDSNRMLRDEKERLQTQLQTAKTELMETRQKLTPLQAENNQFSTQIATLKSEKVILEQDVQRWQQRSQQLLQSPRRQDPEEYRKLLNEKQKLNRNIDQLNKEITDKKLEVSNLQGEIRSLNQQMESVKSENISFAKKIETMDADVKAKQGEMEEKNKTIAQIRRVGRRYKMQFEELQKKQQEADASQQKATDEVRAQEASAEATVAEQVAKISALEASLVKTSREKEEMQKQLQSKSAEMDGLKNELQLAQQKVQESAKVSTGSELAEEIQKLTNERDEIKKQLQDKEEKSKRLLTLAKNRIEQIRKDKDEIASERDRLRSDEEKQKGEVEKLKQDVRTETEQKLELQSKIEDLQKQLTTATSQQQQQNKVTSVVGHQIHHHSGSGSVELRKAANIRPISTQRVSQVSPMRVTRTARVMPEPQQEAQEGSSTDSLPARSSPLTQIASSSHLAAPMSVSTSATMPTRALVHPINPSAGRHQHVVSSTPSSSAIHQIPTRSDASQVEQAVVRGNTSSSTDNQPQEAAVSSVVAMPTDVSESDQAIVSSSDDQPAQSEEGQSPFTPASSGQAQTSSTTTATESEAAPAQSSTASSSGDALVSGSTIPVLLGRQVYKRSYDDASETNSTTDETPASSSDAHVSVPPVPKRQRSSPDQSSAAIQPLTLQMTATGETSGTQVQQAESSVLQSEVKSSTERDTSVPGTSNQVEHQEGKDEDDTVGTSTFTPIPEMVAPSSESQSIPTSSGASDVIVVSSDDEADDNTLNVEREQDNEIYDDEEEAAIDVEPEEGEAEPEDLTDQVPSNSTRPVLVLHPTPPEIYRNRPPIRPAPLTPGLVPPAADDGDGIVPCTPTLPTRRHDDNYQTINSPHVPPGGPPIRFRFEDVTVPGPVQSFQSQSEIGAVDDTIMDFSDEARNVPTTPVVPGTSITTVTHTLIEPQMRQAEVPAVSSSNAEEEEAADEEKDDAGGEMCVPISSSLPEDAGNLDNSSSADIREMTTNLQNIRGRRIRLIGGRSRGKGGTSPSTSTQ